MMFFFRKRLRLTLWLASELLWRMEQHLEEIILSANSDAITEITAQVQKGTAEVVERVAALEEAVANGEDLSGALADLRAAAQSLDDLNPDVPSEPEVPSEPAE